MDKVSKKTMLWLVAAAADLKLASGLAEGKKVGVGEVVGERVVKKPEGIKWGYDQLSEKEKIRVLEILKKKEGGRFWQGERLVEFGPWWQKKQLIAPQDGVLVEVDKEGRIFWSDGNVQGESKIKVPVSGKLVLKEKKWWIEFEGYEWMVEEICGGDGAERRWGGLDPRVVRRLLDIGVEDEGRILLAVGMERSWLAKAEVMGVRGIVVGSETTCDGGGELPVVRMSDTVWDKMINWLESSDKNKLAMIDPVKKRLVIVLES